MASLQQKITNNSSRPEIDHSKSSDNVLLKLNIESYSEPMHYDYRTANKLQPQPQQSSQNPNNTNTQSQNPNTRIDFNEFVSSRQFSFENIESNPNTLQNTGKRKSHNEGFIPIDDNDNDSDSNHSYYNNDRESSCSPSPTPIVSDLDELLADTPNIQRAIMTPNNDTNNIPIPSANGMGVHGISIPYNIDSDYDSESDTPEPCDTPISTPHMSICPYGINQEIKLSSDDDENDQIDYGQFISDEPVLSPALSPKSRSWQPITMTKQLGYNRKCMKIKCITPITQEMAEWKLSNIYSRRRSVANITPSVHKLFKLDDDLLKIREEYLKRTNNNNQIITHDQTNDINHTNNNNNNNNNRQTNQPILNTIKENTIKENTNTKINTIDTNTNIKSDLTNYSFFNNVLSNSNVFIGIFISLGIIYFVSKNKKPTNTK